MCIINQSILSKALAEERPFLPPQEADAEILRLHRQVGQLEERNGTLERVVKTLCRHYCALRDGGHCDGSCPGRDYCDTEGLVAIHFRGKRQEETPPPPQPSPLAGGGGKKEPEAVGEASGNQTPRVCLGNAGDVY